jgi:hypothetical protein
MQKSFEVLQSTQWARILGSGRSEATPPNGGADSDSDSEPWLEAMRQRNAVLDWLFYDVGVVTQDEATRLSPWLAAEGAILFVPPSGAGLIKICASVDEFAASHADQARAVAVAGVGSSALGAAAFARNVADALGAPVAAVVSGYGLADLATEALGGFFLFGAANSIRHQFDWLNRLRETGIPAEASTRSASKSADRRRSDTDTVLALLSHRALGLKLLVGHSKGNLVISEALYTLKTQAPTRLKALAEQVFIVTVSAKIAMPPDFKRIVDVMGQFDGFGALNSRWDLGTEVSVPFAWHHTNTELPMHLPVAATLRQLPEIAQL